MNELEKDELEKDELEKDELEKDEFIVDAMLNSLDGSINSQGIKISHRNFLDMGSKEWTSTPDNIKALAYKAMHATGWTDIAVKKLMLNKYKHIDKTIIDYTFDHLTNLTKEHIIDIVEEEISESQEIKLIKEEAKKYLAIKALEEQKLNEEINKG